MATRPGTSVVWQLGGQLERRFKGGVGAVLDLEQFTLATVSTPTEHVHRNERERAGERESARERERSTKCHSAKYMTNKQLGHLACCLCVCVKYCRYRMRRAAERTWGKWWMVTEACFFSLINTTIMFVRRNSTVLMLPMLPLLLHSIVSLICPPHADLA